VERYICRLSIKLSRNYNSLEASAEYGRDIKPGETTKSLVQDVESITQSRLNALTAIIDKQLGDRKTK